VVFVEGALPGEDAEVRIFKQGQAIRRRRGDLARALPGPAARAALRALRRMRRLRHAARRRANADGGQAALARGLLERIGKVKPESLLPIVYGEEWGYRHRARLSVRRVEKKGGVLVGFRERRSTYIADMRECPVLPDRVSNSCLTRTLIESTLVRERVPQIEGRGRRQRDGAGIQASPAIDA
jgi:23S rRNA (uracil1939-C5)-methyltransferase